MSYIIYLKIFLLLGLELIIQVLHKKLSADEQEQFYPLIPLPKINNEIVTKILQKFDSINVCYGAAPVTK